MLSPTPQDKLAHVRYSKPIDEVSYYKESVEPGIVEPISEVANHACVTPS